jgi:transposase
MRYLGMDVHVKSTVWCLLDAGGEVVEKGKSPTTAAELAGLVQRLAKEAPLVAAQECGKLSHFVHDVLSPLDVKLLTFNPYHLRVIAASRKKTDKRDAYWLARTVQSGMTPHPVYIPTGVVRQLRALLNERDCVTGQRKAWLVRASTLLQAAGLDARQHSGKGWIEKLLQQPDGIDEQLKLALERCDRMALALTGELAVIDARLHQHATSLEQVQRLQTIPAIGEKVALTIYAWVGDISRFHTARQLSAYAGLTPSVRQSADSSVTGRITKEGSKQLRRALTQAGHVLLFRCQSENSAPLKAKPARIAVHRARRKIAVVAAARHILRTAFYVLRDRTDYNPALLRSPAATTQAA